jgi:hypothetical protein
VWGLTQEKKHRRELLRGYKKKGGRDEIMKGLYCHVKEFIFIIKAVGETLK